METDLKDSKSRDEIAFLRNPLEGKTSFSKEKTFWLVLETTFIWKNVRQNGSWNPRYLGVKIKDVYLKSPPSRLAFTQVSVSGLLNGLDFHLRSFRRGGYCCNFLHWNRSLTYLLWNGKNGWKFQNAVFKVCLSVFHVGFLHSTALICYPFYWITTKTRLQAQKL